MIFLGALFPTGHISLGWTHCPPLGPWQWGGKEDLKGSASPPPAQPPAPASSSATPRPLSGKDLGWWGGAGGKSEAPGSARWVGEIGKWGGGCGPLLGGGGQWEGCPEWARWGTLAKLCPCWPGPQHVSRTPASHPCQASCLHL